MERRFLWFVRGWRALPLRVSWLPQRRPHQVQSLQGPLVDVVEGLKHTSRSVVALALAFALFLSERSAQR
jgi:hypothetical protein